MNIHATSNITVEHVLDVDSHEMVPVELRTEIFGPSELIDVAEIFTIGARRPNHPNKMSMPDKTGDVTPINHETVWHLKGSTAPSAIDLRRRPAVMDLMGIERQLVYPHCSAPWGARGRRAHGRVPRFGKSILCHRPDVHGRRRRHGPSALGEGQVSRLAAIGA